MFFELAQPDFMGNFRGLGAELPCNVQWLLLTAKTLGPCLDASCHKDLFTQCPSCSQVVQKRPTSPHNTGKPRINDQGLTSLRCDFVPQITLLWHGIRMVLPILYDSHPIWNNCHAFPWHICHEGVSALQLGSWWTLMVCVFVLHSSPAVRCHVWSAMSDSARARRDSCRICLCTRCFKEARMGTNRPRLKTDGWLYRAVSFPVRTDFYCIYSFCGALQSEISAFMDQLLFYGKN